MTTADDRKIPDARPLIEVVLAEVQRLAESLTPDQVADLIAGRLTLTLTDVNPSVDPHAR